MNNSTGSEDYETVYMWRPLNVAVPDMGNMQARKNPFNKQSKLKTCDHIDCKSLLPHIKEQQIINNFSKTVANLKDCSLNFFKLITDDEDILFSEITETITESNCEWASEDSISNHKTNDMSSKPVLTKEMAFNFGIIQGVVFPTLEEIKNKTVNLRTDKSTRLSDKTLLLDLDDTLIHTINPKFDYSLINIDHSSAKIIFYKDPETSSLHSIKVVIRPYATELLQQLSKYYEIVIFTAAQKCYADPILDLLDPENEYISRRLYRESCIEKNDRFFKDLRIFANRDISKLIIVDNTITCFGNHLNNGIHVPSYLGQIGDVCLKYITELLKEISKCENVQKELMEKVGLEKLYKEFIN